MRGAPKTKMKERLKIEQCVLPLRAIRALQNNFCIDYLDQCQNFTESDLLNAHSFGLHCLNALKSELNKHNLHLKCSIEDVSKEIDREIAFIKGRLTALQLKLNRLKYAKT